MYFYQEVVQKCLLRLSKQLPREQIIIISKHTIMNKNYALFFAFCFISTLSFAQVEAAKFAFFNGEPLDLSVNSNHGLIIGDATAGTDRNGNPGMALELQGGFASIDDAPALKITDQITVSVWMYIPSSFVIDNWIGVVNKWSAAGGYYMGINPDNLRMRWNCFVANIEDPQSVLFNTWMHYAATYNGQTMKLYRDGVLVNETFAPGGIPDNAFPFRVGRQSNGGGQAFEATIDDVVIYHGALTEQEIQDLYNNDFELNDWDVILAGLDINSFYEAPTNIPLSGRMQNVCNNNVTSFDLHWSDGINTYSHNVSSVNIATGQNFQFTHPDQLVLQLSANEDIDVWIDNINGNVDENMNNNSAQASVEGVAFIPNRRMVVEEATGTWCGWCPRGAVGLDHMTENYPDNFIGIAVHNGDPMTLAEYDDAAGFSAFPTCRINRLDPVTDPSADNLENLFHQTTVEQLSIASIEHQATYNQDTRELVATLTSEFVNPYTGDFRFSIVLTEDGVTSTEPGYAQANYYSGGTTPMAGYENLPNPVPADQMVYDHVGRALIGGYDGVLNSIPSSVAIGEQYDYTFNYTLPDEFNDSQMHVVSLVLNAQTGEIINAIASPLSDFITSTNEQLSEISVNVAPNPFSNQTNIQLTLENPSEVSVQVFDAMGKIVAEKDYGLLTGKMILPFDGYNLSNGMYYFQITADDQRVTKKVSLIK